MRKTATTKQATKSVDNSQPWSINQVRLIGRLTADPSTRETKAGAVASFRVATNSSRVAEFHDIVVWGTGAEHVASFHKGEAVRVEGRLRTHTWTGRDGGTRRTTEIVASLVEPFTPPVA